MPEDKKQLLKKYLQQRRESGEEGFFCSCRKNTERKAVVTESVSVKALLNKLEKDVLKCKQCSLGSSRLNPCFGEGSPSAEIMFVGEGPGYTEDHMGRVFVGRAGKLLDRIISGALKTDRSRVYIANIVKCHPMKDPSDPEKRGNDRPPSADEVKSCLPYLQQQVALIKPKVIVPLGSPSAKTILGTDERITDLRGKVYEREFGPVKVKIVPTYHPAYLLRNSSKKAEVYEDTKLILSLL